MILPKAAKNWPPFNCNPKGRFVVCMIDLKVHARVPTPNRTLDELAKVSPDLGNLLPALTTMAKAEAVSPFFTQLYETKVRELRENLNRLDLLLSRHNFYDCQTVLALKHPETKRRALLFQADMALIIS